VARRLTDQRPPRDPHDLRLRGLIPRVVTARFRWSRRFRWIGRSLRREGPTVT